MNQSVLVNGLARRWVAMKGLGLRLHTVTDGLVKHRFSQRMTRLSDEYSGTSQNSPAPFS